MKTLLLLTALFSFSAFAGEKYTVTKTEQKESGLTISYKTNSINRSMCYMTTTELKLTLESIEITSSVLPGSICMMAFGPHRGSITFNVGDRLPNLIPGNVYQLIINGEVQDDLITVE
jgi:hypothetical protein